MSAYTSVELEPRDAVLIMRLNRPDKRNALDDTMQAELSDALLAAAEAPEVRGVVLTGAGAAFSAGGDLSRFTREWDTPQFRLYSHRLTQLVTLIERIEKPIVAAINGLATGAGTQLALACDLRIAAEDARFLMREGRIGIIPSHGGCARLVKLVGLARARDIVLGGADLSAAEAFGYGLLTRVVPGDTLMDAVLAQFEQIFLRAPQSYGLAKRLLLLAANVDLESGLLAESLAQSLLIETDDHKEGVQAALEKRAPTFRGT
jgi:enoyl-CoA hydratase/carnithine racemase